MGNKARRIEVLTRTAETFVEVLSLGAHLALAEETARLAEDVAGAVGKRVQAAKTFTVERTRRRRWLWLRRRSNETRPNAP